MNFLCSSLTTLPLLLLVAVVHVAHAQPSISPAHLYTPIKPIFLITNLTLPPSIGSSSSSTSSSSSSDSSSGTSSPPPSSSQAPATVTDVLCLLSGPLYGVVEQTAALVEGKTYFCKLPLVNDSQILNFALVLRGGNGGSSVSLSVLETVIGASPLRAYDFNVTAPHDDPVSSSSTNDNDNHASSADIDEDDYNIFYQGYGGTITVHRRAPLQASTSLHDQCSVHTDPALFVAGPPASTSEGGGNGEFVRIPLTCVVDTNDDDGGSNSSSSTSSSYFPTVHFTTATTTASASMGGQDHLYTLSESLTAFFAETAAEAMRAWNPTVDKTPDRLSLKLQFQSALNSPRLNMGNITVIDRMHPNRSRVLNITVNRNVTKWIQRWNSSNNNSSSSNNDEEETDHHMHSAAASSALQNNDTSNYFESPLTCIHFIAETFLGTPTGLDRAAISVNGCRQDTYQFVNRTTLCCFPQEYVVDHAVNYSSTTSHTSYESLIESGLFVFFNEFPIYTPAHHDLYHHWVQDYYNHSSTVSISATDLGLSTTATIQTRSDGLSSLSISNTESATISGKVTLSKGSESLSQTESDGSPSHSKTKSEKSPSASVDGLSGTESHSTSSSVSETATKPVSISNSEGTPSSTVEKTISDDNISSTVSSTGSSTGAETETRASLTDSDTATLSQSGQQTVSRQETDSQGTQSISSTQSQEEPSTTRGRESASETYTGEAATTTKSVSMTNTEDTVSSELQQTVSENTTLTLTGGLTATNARTGSDEGNSTLTLTSTVGGLTASRDGSTFSATQDGDQSGTKEAKTKSSTLPESVTETRTIRPRTQTITKTLPPRHNRKDSPFMRGDEEDSVLNSIAWAIVVFVCVGIALCIFLAVCIVRCIKERKRRHRMAKVQRLGGGNRAPFDDGVVGNGGGGVIDVDDAQINHEGPTMNDPHDIDDLYADEGDVAAVWGRDGFEGVEAALAAGAVLDSSTSCTTTAAVQPTIGVVIPSDPTEQSPPNRHRPPAAALAVQRFPPPTAMPTMDDNNDNNDDDVVVEEEGGGDWSRDEGGEQEEEQNGEEILDFPLSPYDDDHIIQEEEGGEEVLVAEFDDAGVEEAEPHQDVGEEEEKEDTSPRRGVKDQAGLFDFISSFMREATAATETESVQPSLANAATTNDAGEHLRHHHARSMSSSSSGSDLSFVEIQGRLSAGGRRTKKKKNKQHEKKQEGDEKTNPGEEAHRQEEQTNDADPYDDDDAVSIAFTSTRPSAAVAAGPAAIPEGTTTQHEKRSPPQHHHSEGDDDGDDGVGDGAKIKKTSVVPKKQQQPDSSPAHSRRRPPTPPPETFKATLQANTTGSNAAGSSNKSKPTKKKTMAASSPIQKKAWH